jgi:succinate dehydrogenase/fumarate reductase-like Fe-S protein
VPFAREYGGLLDNRSFGGVQVQRTFYARGQTGQQLLLGAYQALQEQVAASTVTMHTRSELLDVVIVNGRARGIVTRDLMTGQLECHAADVVVLATGGYSDGDSLTLEPWRARAFPVVRDLIVNRSAFDRIIQAGGFISAPTGSAPDANAVLVPKEAADTAFDAAACIGCGACVAACPNAADMLFTSTKITHLNSLPQGQPQRDQRTLSMVMAMANEGFGSCTNHGECEAVCPKEIPLEFIGKMNRDLMRAVWRRRREPLVIPGIIQQPFHEHVGIEAERA